MENIVEQGRVKNKKINWICVAIILTAIISIPINKAICSNGNKYEKTENMTDNEALFYITSLDDNSFVEYLNMISSSENERITKLYCAYQIEKAEKEDAFREGGIW